MSRTFKFIAIILLNILIVTVEIIFGIISNSLALITDALHNFGDIISLVISFLASIFATKGATGRNSFGYIRAEMMATFINSASLIITMAFVLQESINGILSSNQDIVNGKIIMFVALIALIANSISAYLLLQLQDGKRDLNIKSAYLHFLGDSLLSLGVIIGGAMILFFEINMIDRILGIIFAIYIILASIPLLVTSFKSLMDIHHSIDISEIEKEIIKIEGVHSLHHAHLIEPSPKHSFFYTHLTVQNNLTLDEVSEIILKIETILKKFEINHSVIQPEIWKNIEEPLLIESYSSKD